MINQVFAYKWLAAVGTARRYLLAVAFGVVRHTLVHVKTGIANRLVAGNAKEVLRVPGGSKGINIVSPDWLFTLFANWLRWHRCCRVFLDFSARKRASLILCIEVEVCGAAANFHFDTLVVGDLRRYKTTLIFND